MDVYIWRVSTNANKNDSIPERFMFFAIERTTRKIEKPHFLAPSQRTYTWISGRRHPVEMLFGRGEKRKKKEKKRRTSLREQSVFRAVRYCKKIGRYYRGRPRSANRRLKFSEPRNSVCHFTGTPLKRIRNRMPLNFRQPAKFGGGVVEFGITINVIIYRTSRTDGVRSAMWIGSTITSAPSAVGCTAGAQRNSAAVMDRVLFRTLSARPRPKRILIVKTRVFV